METSPESVIVLTPQGEFLQVPWSQKEYPLLGSEIEFTVPLKKTYLPKANYLTYMAASILLLVFVAAQFLGGLLPGAQQVVAYVTIDINPSIELGINPKGKVIEVKGLNADGEKILQNVNVLELDVEQAITIITREAVKEQYLTTAKENNIVITVSGEDKSVAKTKNLDTLASKVLEENKLAGKVEIVEVPKEIHDKAKELGVSSGKYVILLEALDQGLDLSLDDVKGNSIIKAVKKAGGIPGELIAKAQKDKHVLKELELRHSKNVMARIESLKKTDKNIPADNEDKKDKKDEEDREKKTPPVPGKGPFTRKTGSKAEEVLSNIRNGLEKDLEKDPDTSQDNTYNKDDDHDKDGKDDEDDKDADKEARKVDNNEKPNNTNGNVDQDKKIPGFVKRKFNSIK